jgi:glutathione S-transferase
MALQFYFAPMSTAEVTDAVIRELGVTCERIELDIGKGETRSPEFLKINPNGRVPVIVHDGAVIWESAAITMYLAETFGVERGLYPELGPKRGEAMKWTVWSNVVLAEAGGRLAANIDPGVPGSTTPGSQDHLDEKNRSACEAAKAKADIVRCFEILNEALSGRDFLLIEYTVVDTHVQSLAGWLVMMGADLERFPHLAAWIERVNRRNS